MFSCSMCNHRYIACLRSISFQIISNGCHFFQQNQQNGVLCRCIELDISAVIASAVRFGFNSNFISFVFNVLAAVNARGLLVQ